MIYRRPDGDKTSATMSLHSTRGRAIVVVIVPVETITIVVDAIEIIELINILKVPSDCMI